MVAIVVADGGRFFVERNNRKICIKNLIKAKEEVKGER